MFLTVLTSEVTRQDSPSVHSAPTLKRGGGEVVEVEGGVILAGDPGHRGEAQHGAHGRQTHLIQQREKCHRILDSLTAAKEFISGIVSEALGLSALARPEGAFILISRARSDARGGRGGLFARNMRKLYQPITIQLTTQIGNKQIMGRINRKKRNEIKNILVLVDILVEETFIVSAWFSFYSFMIIEMHDIPS